jgi:hypothetical protein
VRLRLNRRLQGRLDPSDVLQEAYLDIALRAPECAANPAVAALCPARLLRHEGSRDVALSGDIPTPRRPVSRPPGRHQFYSR